MDKNRSIKPGVYEHYKGGRYVFVGCAKHSETLEDLVIYQSISDPAKIWARPTDMFLGSVVIDGKAAPRFRYLGEK
ncbi:DUF1653 domain-containing protein [Candidatus Saccharibacteria bacterium]|nr:DUF1653 domain-containing protein [Candidatus Saccharibacteria bacterium]